MTLAPLFPDDNDDNLSAVSPHSTSPATPPSCWVPIVRVSKEQGVRYSFLYEKVKVAHRQHSPWVRREPDPLVRGRFRWSVDTASPSYQTHLHAWHQTSKLASPQHGRRAASPTASNAQSLPSAHPTTPAVLPPLPTGGVQDTLPDLCQWLSSQGLMIFQDALAPAHAWCWTWNGVLCKGYATMADAFTAALKDRLLTDDGQWEDADPHRPAPWAAWDAEEEDGEELNRGGLDGLHALLDELDEAPQEEATPEMKATKSATRFSFWPLRL